MSSLKLQGSSLFAPITALVCCPVCAEVSDAGAPPAFAVCRLSVAYYNLRRSAAGLLRELVIFCRRNQKLLLSPEHAEAYVTLMGTILRECGDRPTQVRLFWAGGTASALQGAVATSQRPEHHQARTSTASTCFRLIAQCGLSASCSHVLSMELAAGHVWRSQFCQLCFTSPWLLIGGYSTG